MAKKQQSYSPFSMRLDPTLKAQLVELAEKEDRTLTNYVERMLKRCIAVEMQKKK